MTDRELLEAAARAAGIEYLQEGGSLWIDYGIDSREWNPLTDDGDALRLAVKLRLCHLWQHDWLMIYSGDTSVRERDLSYPYAATRRAIVRAAAALGEQA